MRVTTVREFKNKATIYLRADEPVLVTRHGKLAGILLPFNDPDHFPVDLRRELLIQLGDYIRRTLEEKGISEEEVLDDFAAHRKGRSRR